MEEGAQKQAIQNKKVVRSLLGKTIGGFLASSSKE